MSRFWTDDRPFRRRIAGVILVTLLAACAGPTELSPAAPSSASPPASSPPSDREPPLEQWLAQADRALSADRLLTPLADNAHDRYRAVLLYDPDNSRAISGLQAVALRYLDLARSAAAREAFAQAEGYLELAEGVDPGNPLVAEFLKRVKAQQSHLQSSGVAAQSVLRLDTEALQARSERVTAQLGALAKQVRNTGEFILIISRTDAEGRWIYQQMREAVPGYLLRADIQLGSPPRVELQPPL